MRDVGGVWWVVGIVMVLSALSSCNDTSLHAQEKDALMKRGEKIYASYCQTCHLANGQGISTVYPPISSSDFIKARGITNVALGVLWGRSGEMLVNGKRYNGVMAPMPTSYTDEDVAAVVTFVMNAWNNPGGIMRTDEVKRLRAAGNPERPKTNEKK